MKEKGRQGSIARSMSFKGTGVFERSTMEKLFEKNGGKEMHLLALGYIVEGRGRKGGKRGREREKLHLRGLEAIKG